MSLRSCAGKFMSRKSLDLDSREVEPIYFDFITYCGVISLSMGAIASFDPRQGATRHATGEAAAANESVR